MLRHVPVIGLLSGLAIGLAAPAPLWGQKAREQFPKPPRPAPAAGNPAPAQPKVIGFNVLGAAGNAGNTNIQQPPNVNTGFNALSNYANLMNGNGVGSGFHSGMFPMYGGNSPYMNNPYAYGSGYFNSMYGNPYGYNPYLYNPYLFLNTGYPTGTYSNVYPTPANIYNYALNYQYLSNPYLNPLSNPAFSGPFPPGVFNSLAGLNSMGFSNLLQAYPLGNGSAPNTPFP